MMSHRSKRNAVVLAGGDGIRLQSFIQRLRGDSLPKQYVRFFGTRSLLEQAFDRAEKLVPRDRVWSVVGIDHLNYDEVFAQLSDRQDATVLLQPDNRGTAAGLLLPLMRLWKTHPDSVVVVMPADHYIPEDDPFLDQIRTGFSIVEKDPNWILLLGVKPLWPERDYGYIMPGEDVSLVESLDFKRVAFFIEKPRHSAARRMMQRGGLWNTGIMIFQVRRMMELIRRSAPFLYRTFETVGRAIGSPDELRIVDDVYRRIPNVDFSRDILQDLARRFISPMGVLALDGVLWSDWGSEVRILKDLHRTDTLSALRRIYPAVALP